MSQIARALVLLDPDDATEALLAVIDAHRELVGDDGRIGIAIEHLRMLCLGYESPFQLRFRKKKHRRRIEKQWTEPILRIYP